MNVHEMHANLKLVKVWGKKIRNLKIVLDIQRLTGWWGYIV